MWVSRYMQFYSREGSIDRNKPLGVSLVSSVLLLCIEEQRFVPINCLSLDGLTIPFCSSLSLVAFAGYLYSSGEICKPAFIDYIYSSDQAPVIVINVIFVKKKQQNFSLIRQLSFEKKRGNNAQRCAGRKKAANTKAKSSA